MNGLKILKSIAIYNLINILIFLIKYVITNKPINLIEFIVANLIGIILSDFILTDLDDVKNDKKTLKKIKL